ncbi:hypothetical protein RA210_U20059 [Rubrivivax sp. A210]|nr:hypothetical protein RA210_U20059 [Rubrivivax sp. A210]
MQALNAMQTPARGGYLATHHPKGVVTGKPCGFRTGRILGSV